MYLDTLRQRDHYFTSWWGSLLLRTRLGSVLRQLEDRKGINVCNRESGWDVSTDLVRTYEILEEGSLKVLSSSTILLFLL